jgi:hypothetical protein
VAGHRDEREVRGGEGQLEDRERDGRQDGHDVQGAAAGLDELGPLPPSAVERQGDARQRGEQGALQRDATEDGDRTTA